MIDDNRERNPLAIAAPYRTAYPVPAGPPPPVWETEAEDAAVPLSQYLWILKRHRWKILAFVAFCMIATVLVSYRLTPIYESTATVDIDRRMPTGIIGQEAMQSTTNDADQFLATQIRLVQSDSVLRPVVNKFRLREVEKDALDEPAQKTARTAEAPVVLKRLKVTRPPNTYLLLISYRSADPELAAGVSNAIAQSYLEHTYHIRIKSSVSLAAFMERQLEELKAKMERSSEALLRFERELNVISPEEKTNILSARLLQLNTEYTNAQGDRMRKEAAFNSVKGGTLESAQVSTQGDALKKLTERLQESQEKFAELKSHFGANHPEYRKTASQVAEIQRQFDATRQSIAQRVEIEYREAASREQMLQRAVAETKAEFDGLNARSFEYQALKREAEADKKLYEELVRKIKEAGINAGFQNSAIRIADLGRPGSRPVFPKIPLNVALAFLFSTFLAVGAAIVHDVLDDTVRDPEQVRRTLRAEVIGSLPQVKSWKTQLAIITQNRGALPEVSGHGSRRRNGHQSVTTYEEAIRTLRNSILLTDFDRRLRTLLVTSASPSEGKSTIAIYLAMVHAQQHHRTLIIDADVRRPSVHKRFDLPNVTGLSNVLTGAREWRDVLLKPESVPDLHILTAGSASPRRAADLLGQGLARVLDDAADEYDLVMVDAPPLLGFPEPLQMAAAVDGVVVVAKAGQTSRKAVANVLTTLRRLRANVVGLVLNEVHKDTSHSYYYYHYYGKYYRNRDGKSGDKA